MSSDSSARPVYDPTVAPPTTQRPPMKLAVGSPQHMRGPRPRTKLMIERLRAGLSPDEVAKEFGVTRGNIDEVRRRWTPELLKHKVTPPAVPLLERRNAKGKPRRCTACGASSHSTMRCSNNTGIESAQNASALHHAYERLDEHERENRGAFDLSADLGFVPCRLECGRDALHAAGSCISRPNSRYRGGVAKEAGEVAPC